MKTPLVSILLPMDGQKCCSPAWIASAASAMAQTYDRFELLVIGDDKPEATEANAAIISDPRFKPIKAELRFNHSFVSEWNTGLRSVAGDVIAFLEPGMIWAPTRLDAALDILYGTDRADLVKGLLIDPEHPESASRSIAHVNMRDECSLLNRAFTPPMGEWLGRLAYHFPDDVVYVSTKELVTSLNGTNDPEPPDTVSMHRRLVQYDGWWRRLAGADAQEPLAFHS